MGAGNRSSSLFARPSFFEGVARIMDIGGTLNEYNDLPDEIVDDLMIRQDWRAVTDEVRKAVRSFAG